MLNVIFDADKSLFLGGFSSTGVASNLPVIPSTLNNGCYYFYLTFTVSNPAAPGMDSFEIYIESGYAAFYSAKGYTKCYDAGGGEIQSWSQSWVDGNLPMSIIIPKGSKLTTIEQNGYPQFVLDTLIVS